MKTMNNNRESGFTLLELLLVIGVAALLLIGGIATYRLVSDGNKTTEATRLLLTLRQETQTMAQQQGGNYTGIAFDSTVDDTASTTPLVASGTLRNQQRNPFNGNIKVEAATNNTTDDNVKITFGNISRSGCGKLVSAINNPNEIISVTVNGAGALTTFPVTAANASAACTQALNTIIWQFP